jgi:Protein of unknown function (DUF1214)
MITRDAIEEFHAITDPILTAAEKVTSLHDGKYWALEGRKPASRALRYEMVQINDDKSVDVWFGPKAPTGRESNWVQTVPGKGWNTLLRLYGPLEPWFDKTWRPGEIELVK